MLKNFPIGNYEIIEYNTPVLLYLKWNSVYWAEVSIEADCKHPFLTTKVGNILVQPTGTFKGIFTTNELKYASTLGYEIKVWKVLNFKNKIYSFKEYIEQMYTFKSDPNVTPAARFLYKLLLNTLYGVTGASPKK